MNVARAVIVLAAAARWTTPALGLPGFGLHVSRVACHQDEEIAPAKAQAIRAAAESFVRALLSPDPASAHERLSPRLKAHFTDEQLASRTAGFLSQVGSLTDVAAERTYFVEVTGEAPRVGMCGKDPAEKERLAYVALANAPEQAHVVVGARARNNRVAFSLWLVPADGAWRIESSWMNVSTLGDEDPAQLRARARAEHAKGHEFNAAVLYAAARDAAYRGPALELAISRSIAEEAGKLKLPPELAGKPPFAWKDGPTTYTVQQVAALSVANERYLLLAHEVPPPRSDAQLDEANQQLFRYVKRRFPEYAQVFAGIVGSAVERGSPRGFRSVDKRAGAR